MDKHSKKSFIQRLMAMSMALLVGFTCLNSSAYDSFIKSIIGSDVTISPTVAAEDLYFYDAGRITLDGWTDSTTHSYSGWTASSITSSVTDNPGYRVADTVDLTTNSQALNVMGCLSHMVNVGTDSVNILTSPNTNGIRTVTDYQAGIPDGEQYYYVARGHVDYDESVTTAQPIKWDVYAWPVNQSASVSITKASAAETYFNKVCNDIVSEVNSDADTFTSAFGNARPEWESGNTKYDEWFNTDATLNDDTSAQSVTDPGEAAVIDGKSLLWKSVDKEGVHYPWISFKKSTGKDYWQIETRTLTDGPTAATGLALGGSNGSVGTVDLGTDTGAFAGTQGYVIYGFSGSNTPGYVTSSTTANVVNGTGTTLTPGEVVLHDTQNVAYAAWVPADRTSSNVSQYTSKYSAAANTIVDNPTDGTKDNYVFAWNSTNNYNTAGAGTGKGDYDTTTDGGPYSAIYKDDGDTRLIYDWTAHVDKVSTAHVTTLADSDVKTVAKIMALDDQIDARWTKDGKKPAATRLYGYWTKATGTGSTATIVTSRNALNKSANMDAYNDAVVTAVGTAGQINVQPVYDVTYDYQRAAGIVNGSVVVSGEQIISTTATDGTTGTHIGISTTGATIVDTVRMVGLTVGQEYTIQGKIAAVGDGQATDTSITQQTQVFTAQSTTASINQTFTFDATQYAGKTLVVYEYLMTDRNNEPNVIVSQHDRYDDLAQQVSYPTISTVATMDSTGLQTTEPISGDDINDDVTISGLRVGETYRITAELWDKTDEVFVTSAGTKVTTTRDFYVDDDGQVYTSSAKTTPVTDITVTSETEGKVATLTTKFENVNLEDYNGDELVVYQHLFSVGTVVKEVATAADNMSTTEEANETIAVTSPTISTTLVDNGTTAEVKGSHNSIVSTATKLVDDVSYTGLTEDASYEYTAKLMTEDGTVIATKTGTVSGAAGKNQKVSVVFDDFDSTATGFNLANKHVYSTHFLYRVIGTDKFLVVSEDDPDNKNQIVYFPGDPALSTSVVVGSSSNPAKTIAQAEVNVTDKVYYVGLTTGESYFVETKLFDLGIKDADGNYSEGTGYVASVDEKTEFSAAGPTGSVDVSFSFSSSNYSGHTLVVHEYLYDGDGKTPIKDDDGNPVKHEDNSDKLQTILVEAPTLDTVATSAATETKTVPLLKETSIQDKVSYTGVVSGKAYVLTTQIFDKKTGLVAAGTTSTKTTFTPVASIGTVTVTAKVNTLPHAGKSLVLVETLTDSATGAVLATHKDMDDEDQTVIVEQPTFTTVATVGSTGSHKVPASASVTISDEITYENLQPDTAYTIRTTFYDKSTGKPVKVDGSAIKATTTSFTPSATSGTTTVEVPLNSINLAGKTLVVFEEFLVGTVVVGGHTDINDEQQTLKVTAPEIDTWATASGSDSHTIPYSSKAVIDDKVKLTDLEVGQSYTLTATLVDKETKKAVSKSTGSTSGSSNNNNSSSQSSASSQSGSSSALATYTFKATKTTEEHTMTLTFDSSAYVGKKLVVYESLSVGGNTVASHEDIDDEDQTVVVGTPTISTVATDTYNGTHTISTPIANTNLLGLTNSDTSKSAESASITDVVNYTGLQKGETYTLITTLIDKATGNPLSGDKGSGTTSTFTATGSSGSVSVTVPIDTALYAGKTVVVYEELTTGSSSSNGSSTGIKHHDINDGNQTVYIGYIETVLNGPSKMNPKLVNPSKKLQLTDRVAFYGLQPGVTYTITGTIMNYDAVTNKVGNSSGSAKVSSGSSSTGAGVAVTPRAKTTTATNTTTTTATTTTTNGASTGSSEDEISVGTSDSSTTGTSTSTNTGATGTTTTTTGTKSTSGSNSALNSVGITSSNGTTTNSSATGNTGSTTTTTTTQSGPTSSSDAPVPGGTSGTSQTLATGGTQTVYGDNMATSVGTFTITFKPTATSGIIEVPFTIDASHLQGHKLVAYEVITIGAKPILAEKNISNENQTVTVNNTSTSSWKTGVESNIGLFTVLGIAFLALAGGFGFMAYRRKKN